MTRPTSPRTRHLLLPTLAAFASALPVALFAKPLLLARIGAAVALAAVMAASAVLGEVGRSERASPPPRVAPAPVLAVAPAPASPGSASARLRAAERRYDDLERLIAELRAAAPLGEGRAEAIAEIRDVERLISFASLALQDAQEAVLLESMERFVAGVVAHPDPATRGDVGVEGLMEFERRFGRSIQQAERRGRPLAVAARALETRLGEWVVQG